MTSPLLSLTSREWEDLCDGCGRCCLVKLEDEDTGELYYTDMACEFLDHGSCRCTQYANRQSKKPECIVLSKTNLDVLQWMPSSCAYRRFHQGLAPISNTDPLSVRNRIVCETEISPENYEDRIIDWIDLA